MTQITPLQIRRQIAHLQRLLVDVDMRLYIASLSGDLAEADTLRAEAERLIGLRDRLKGEYVALVELVADQAAAVVEAERILTEAWYAKGI
jgi:hypothetical protein